MNIYGELKKNSIRLNINTEEIEIKVRPDFYTKVKGTESYQMFFDTATNNKIRDFVSKHRKRLGFLKILEYMFLRNRVLLLVDREVQALMSIRLLHAYATLSLDARVVYIIQKPDDFGEDNLDTIESIKSLNLMEFVVNKRPVKAGIDPYNKLD